MNLFSKHFSYEELTTTQETALLSQNRLEGLLYVAALRRLAVERLEPIREGLGLPVVVHSAFRGRTLNAKVGGAIASQHCLGQAADFNVENYDARAGQLKVMKWIVDQNIPFGQLLLERGCIHISEPRAWAPREIAEYVVATKTKTALDLSGVDLTGFPNKGVEP